MAPGTDDVAADVEPLALRPVIADLLRTRFPIPGSVFLVEGIDRHRVGSSRSWEAVRLLLGDGELCVQALLDDTMHRFVRTGAVAVGAYVRLQTFDLRWALSQQEAGGEEAKGKEREASVVYLLVRDLQTVGWNDSVRVMHLAELAAEDYDVEAGSIISLDEARSDMGKARAVEQPVAFEVPQPTGEASLPAPSIESESEQSHEGNTLERNRASPEAHVYASQKQAPRALVSMAAPKTPKGKRRMGAGAPGVDADLEDAFDASEARTFPPQRSTPGRPRPEGGSSSSSRPEAKFHAPPAMASAPVSLPRDWHDPHIPLKLTTLRSVPHLPYPQNWSVNVLAIVASLSAVEPSHLPPHRQRTARLADPSTAKRVHLTVFLDPEAFSPSVGCAVLLTGVKNHRFDGGSLKKYASDGRNGRRWWFQDPWEMAWCDVGGIKEWWAQMEAAVSGDQGSFGQEAQLAS